MSAKNLLPLFLALSSSSTALAAEEPKAPAGFETLPISSPAQQLVAKKGDVYFLVSGLPARLPSDADPTLVADAAVPESAGEMSAAWDGPVVRAKVGGADKGLEALIGASGEGIRIVMCQWGVGGRAADAAARDACLAALVVKLFDVPHAKDLPFAQPEGFKRTLSPDMLYIGVKDKVVIYAVEAELKVDPAADLQVLTDQVTKTFAADGLVVKEVVPADVGAKKVVRVKGTAQGSTMAGYMVPRPEGTLFFGAQFDGSGEAALDQTLRKMVESSAAPPAPTPSPEAGGADAGPAAATPPKQPPAKDGWKAGVLVAALVGAAALLAVLMRAGAARRARERRAMSRGKKAD